MNALEMLVNITSNTPKENIVDLYINLIIFNIVHLLNIGRYLVRTNSKTKGFPKDPNSFGT